MKRVYVFSLVTVLLFGLLTGCGSDNQSQEANKDQFKIGITQIVQHDALDAVRKGILDGLSSKGFKDGEKIHVDYQNAQNEMNNAVTIANGFVNDNKDMIIAITTPSAQAVAQVTKDIPIVFATVTDPVAAGLVVDMNKTTENITGTSDQLPMKIQVDLIQKFIPNVKKIGVIYSTSEVNSSVQVKDIKDSAKKLGIEVIEAGITNSSEVQVATESLMGKVDAILVPVDNTVVSALEGVLNVAKESKIPVFASDTDSVKRGAIATYGIDYYQMGVQTGLMAARILSGGKISDNPVEVTNQANLTINADAATEFGLSVPMDLVAEAKEIIKQ